MSVTADTHAFGGGFALSFERLGVVFLPSGAGTTEPEPRAYAVLNGGEVYLLNVAGLGPALRKRSPIAALEPVPAVVHDSVRGQHPDRALSFPTSRPDHAVATGGPGLPMTVRWADPERVNLIYGGADTKDVARLRGAVLDGDWDTPHRVAFMDLDVSKAIEQRFLHAVPWEQTEYYDRVVRSIEQGVQKWGCRDEADFRSRLDTLDALYEDMRDNGYRSQAELGMKNPSDEVRVAVRRDGRLLFIDGRHRLAMARVLGMERIPVNVVARHQEWMHFREEVLEYIRPRRGRVYQAVDHPDLRDLPAHHGSERVAMLRRAFEGYDASGKRLVDIGAHWGAMTQLMSEVGFQCTAVEANKRCARIAERLSVATESNYEVWRGDIFELPGADRFDGVLALNVFHHFIKTEELHAKLINFLGSLDADLMVFEPHVSDPPAQMKGAYRNYAEREFVEFVAEHAQLEGIEYLDRASDGRALYLLTRTRAG